MAGELRERPRAVDRGVVAVGLHEGGIGRRRAPSRRRGRHHNSSDDRDENSQRQPRSPTAPQLGPKDQPEGVHVNLSPPVRCHRPVWPARRFTRCIHPCRPPSNPITVRLPGKLRACGLTHKGGTTHCPGDIRPTMGPAGGMAEWTNAQLLKSCEVQASVGSNPTPSARLATVCRRPLFTSAPRRQHRCGRATKPTAESELTDRWACSMGSRS